MISLKHLKLPLLLALIMLAGMAAGAPDVNMEITANRPRIYLGESFILQVQISGAERGMEPDLSGIADAEIRNLGTREISNFSVVITGGRVVREGFSGRIVSYEITPRKSGLFRAGPITLEVDGRVITDPGPEVTVTDITPRDEIDITVEASRETVLIDESFDVRLRIRIRALPGKYAASEPLFPNNPPHLHAPFLDNTPIPGLQGPDMREVLRGHLVGQPRQPGIAINNYTLADDPFNFRGFFGGLRERQHARFSLPRRMVEENGRSYFEYYLDLTFTPEIEGDYVFGPVTFKGLLPVSVDEYGHAVSEDIFAVGHACTVRVVPPPEAGRPISFTGAIGTNVQFNAALDCLSCNAGDPVSLTLTVAGNLRFDRLLPPRLGLQANLLDDFAVYDQTVRTIDSVPGQRSYIYTIRPRHAGMLEVPPLEFSWFDTDKRDYRKTYSDPVPLEVHPGVEITADHIIGPAVPVDDDGVPVADKDLVPAPLRPSDAGSGGISLFGGTAVWLTMLAGPSLFLFTLIGKKWRGRRQRECLLQQRRAVLPRALKQLRHLTHLPAAEAATSICQVIREFTGARFQRGTSAMTPDDLRRILVENNIAKEIVEPLSGIYQRYFEAGYNSAPASSNISDDCAQLATLLQKKIA